MHDGKLMFPREAYKHFREHGHPREIPRYAAQNMGQYNQMKQIHDQIWEIFDEREGNAHRRA